MAKVPLIAAIFICLAIAKVHSQDASVHENRVPKIIRVIPATISPGMSIDLEGYYLDDFPQNKQKVTVLFRQDEKRYVTTPWGREGRKGSKLQTINVKVPDEVGPGEWDVVVQVGEVMSIPFVSQIGFQIPPPLVTSETPTIAGILKPRSAQPGDVLFVEGTNFSEKDEVEITDAQGRIHRTVPRTGSSATLLSFVVPDGVGNGEAVFQIVELRSGMHQRSKRLLFHSRDAAIPIEVSPSCTRSVAPGELITLCPISLVPLRRAKQIEVVFLQHGRSTVTKGDSLRLTVPESLLPGDVLIMTRVWREFEVSEWSQPFLFKLIDR